MKSTKLSWLLGGVILIVGGGVALCGGQLTKNSRQTSNSTFLTISDIHLNQLAQEVSYGCDTGTKLWSRAQSKLGDLISSESPKFILYLGDLPVHSYQRSPKHGPPCVQSPESYIHTSVGEVLGGLRTAATGKVPLLYLPGNNDGYGGDYSSFTDSISTTQAYTPFTQDHGHAKDWPIIDDTNTAVYLNGNREQGYYSAYPMGKPASGKPGLRVIMMNTVIFTVNYYDDKDNVTQSTAGTNQLIWLGEELDKAKTAKDSVIIAMHIPPGRDTWNGSHNWNEGNLYNNKKTGEISTFQAKFLSEVKAHSPEIVGILTSHTHTDGLKRILDGNKVVELTISTPGVSVNHSNNPGMKVFDFNPANYQLMNFTTYYTTPSADPWGSNSYTFYDAYGTSSNSMLGQIQKITNNNPSGTQSTLAGMVDKILYVRSPQGGSVNAPSALDISIQ